MSSLWRMLLIGFFCLPLAVTNAHQQTATALEESAPETELSISELAQLAKTDPRVLLSLLTPSSSTYLTLPAANSWPIHYSYNKKSHKKTGILDAGF